MSLSQTKTSKCKSCFWEPSETSAIPSKERKDIGEVGGKKAGCSLAGLMNSVPRVHSMFLVSAGTGKHSREMGKLVI